MNKKRSSTLIEKMPVFLCIFQIEEVNIKADSKKNVKPTSLNIEMTKNLDF